MLGVLLARPFTLTAIGIKQSSGTPAGNWKLIWSTPGRPGAGPEYEGATPIPATSTNTVESVDPRPVPQSVTQSPACTGVVRPIVRGVLLQTCATAASSPAAALVKMPKSETAIHTVVE